LLFTRHLRFGENQFQSDQSEYRHQIKYLKVDADIGKEVGVRRYYEGKVDTDSYIEVTKDELENIALDSNRTIDIDEFVSEGRI
jgi:DNA end-binding protein Ku